MPEHLFPQLERQRKIAVALGEARERAAGGAVGFSREIAIDRLRVVFSSARGFAAAFADAREAEKLEAVVAVLFRIREQRQGSRGECGEAAQIHLVVVEDRKQGFGCAAAKIVEAQLGD